MRHVYLGNLLETVFQFKFCIFEKHRASQNLPDAKRGDLAGLEIGC